MNVVSSSNWRELGTSFLNLGVPWYYTDPSCALLEKSTGIIQLSPEGDVNSGTNQLDKIKKETFCNKKCHLVRVCLVFNWQCFGKHFYDFVAISVGKCFSIDQWTSQILSFSWYLLVQLLHLPLQFHQLMFRNCRQTRSHFESRLKTMDFPRYGSQSERAKIPILWRGGY